MNNASLARRTDRFAIGSPRSTNAPNFWAAAWLLSSTLSGCVTTPPVAVEATVREAPCPFCEEQTREIVRLREDLANKEGELRDLRSSRRDQGKVLQESTREVTRAKVKLRRLATQADAASYIAEVEVAMVSLRSSSGATSKVPLIVLAQGILESTATPFAQGDYGVAIDRAAQAEQLIGLVANDQVRPALRRGESGEVPLLIAIPLKATVNTNLRRKPLRKASVVGALKKDARLVAHTYKGGWLQVETEDGRSGWVNQTELGVR